MKDKTLTYLDYFKLLDLLRGYSKTPYIDEALSAIRPLNNIDEIQERQDKIEALMEVVKWDGQMLQK